MEQEPEGAEEDEEEDGETPRGGQWRSNAWGGMPPPQRKTQTSWNSTQNVRTCCCRESIETSRIITTGCTWTGESWMTLYGSVIGAGLLLIQQAGMPLLPEQWGPASW